MDKVPIDILQLRQAIEASWQPDTAYLEVYEQGNPSLGQCYPTSRVVQHYLPESEIVEGTVRTSEGIEKHFWNLLNIAGSEIHIDFTWQQFPNGSIVDSWRLRDRNTLNDGEATLKRVDLILGRVAKHLTLLNQT